MSETTQPVRSGHPPYLRGEGLALPRVPLPAPAKVQPLIRPAPRSAMFFPLVVLVAVLPGLVALNCWDLTPPGPWWGLRALAVVDGLVIDQIPAAREILPLGESAAFRAVAFQPPLYAWLAAIGLMMSVDLDPLASVLPSYAAGVLVVILVYLHGRLWRGGGLGLAAAVLVGFNPSLLLRMQEATPTTLAAAGAVGTLLCYGWHERVGMASRGQWTWGGPVFWAIGGGVSLALTLLAVGGFGLIAIPVVVLHQFFLGAETPAGPAARARSRSRSWAWIRNPGLRNGLFAVAIAMVLALPWHIWMVRIHGWEAVLALQILPWTWVGEKPGLLARLLALAPVTLPLALYGAARSIRLALLDETQKPEAVGGSLWVIWLGVAALAPAFWPGGPRGAMDLFLLVPLHLLAAATVADLVNRRVPVRVLVGLAPASAVTFTWWASKGLQGAVQDLIHGRATTATLLGMHLAVDLVLGLVLLVRGLERWSQRRDDRQRQVLAGFLLAVLGVTVATGIREVVFRHGETNDLLTLRTMVLRRNRDHPFNQLCVVGPDPVSAHADENALAFPLTNGFSSGGRLRFILRTTLPNLPQRDLNSVDELLALPEGNRLIILTGSSERLSSAVKSKLGLEAIHPGRSGILDAYATAHDRSSRR
jgi:hypothetical protein